MPQDAYIYSVMTAVMGMLIVFAFLALLSFLMFAIKEIFGEQPIHEPGRAAAAQKVDAQTAAAEERIARKKSGAPEWVTAATTVFLMEEALEARRSAEAWRPSREEKYDPWVTFPRG
jgi:sodium pump decarboxylase gamma subunit